MYYLSDVTLCNQCSSYYYHKPVVHSFRELDVVQQGTKTCVWSRKVKLFRAGADVSVAKKIYDPCTILGILLARFNFVFHHNNCSGGTDTE